MKKGMYLEEGRYHRCSNIHSSTLLPKHSIQDVNTSELNRSGNLEIIRLHATIHESA